MRVFLLSAFLSFYYTFCCYVSSSYRGLLYNPSVQNLTSVKYLILREILKFFHVISFVNDSNFLIYATRIRGETILTQFLP